jgi:hypothetical protein
MIRRIEQPCAAINLGLLVGGYPFEGVGAVMETIFSVDSVEIVPPQDGKFVVEATGTVSPTGWTNPNITGACFVESDGSLHYLFQAQRPPGEALQVLSRVTARSEFGDPGTSPEGLPHVRVTGNNGDVSAPFPPGC